MLLTQLQQDTKGNIMDIFLLIYQDYLGPSPIFDDRWFQQIIRISQNVYD